ncbi:MAG: Holliday junction branch migration protein RuvA [Rikenellaceae bacterium]|jgi:Holliday junction DNA helicase RuvA|nr:Holliday junction branch migration protein RuvA [Rikenellaceae bacterium]
MYEFISGRVAELTPAYAVIDAGGVGYYLNISLQTFSEIEGRSEALLYAHFTVREDAQILYGFGSREEREVFRRLVSVSGVGGNTARMVLSTYSPAELANIISSENAVLLKNVKGLGLKTAEKIIVELRDKMVGITSSASVNDMAAGDATHSEALAALAMLGFSRAASDKVVRSVMKDNPAAPVEDIIRLSLKKL